MADLETAFYIVGLVYMGVMLLLTIVVVAAVLVIRSKIVSIHNQIDEKFHNLHQWVDKGEAVVGTVKKFARGRRK